MKTIAALAVSLLILAPVQAQSLHSQTLGGALLGGVAGAIIGNNSGDLHHNAWRGAAIGTVAGAVLGSAVGESREGHRYYGTQVPMPRGYNSYGYGPGYGHYGYGRSYGYGSAYRSPAYYGGYHDRGYSGRPNYAGSGLLLGGLAGGIIGNNSHSHNTWRGAAIGAGAGLLLGSIAERNASANDQRDAVLEDARRAAEIRGAAEQSSTPQNVTIINNYYGTSATPMSSANSMFGR